MTAKERAAENASSWEAHRDDLAHRYTQALRATLFQSRSMVRPTMLKELAETEATALIDFFREPILVVAGARGRRLAQVGLGIEAVLRLARTARQFCLEVLPEGQREAALAQVESYYDTLVRAFTQENEAVILEEQERIRGALQSTLGRYATQLEVSTGVSHAVSSILDLEPLLQTAVTLLQEQFDLDYVGLFLLDESGRWAVLRAATGEAGQKMLASGHRLEVGGASLVGQCAARREPRLVLDVGERGPVRFELSPLSGIHSELVVPLLTRGEVSGVLALQSRQVAAFSEQDVNILTMLAGQLANAIQNAHLFQKHEQRIRELSILNEIGRILSLSLGLDDLLEHIQEQVGRIFDVTNFYIALYREGEEEWEMRLQVERGERRPVRRHPLGAGATGYILRTRRPLLLRTRAEADAFDREQGIPLLGEQSASWMGVPLIAADKIVGVMAVQNYDQENLYDERDLTLFSTIAAQMAVALDNRRLLEEAHRRMRELELLNEVGRALTSILDRKAVLQQIVDLTKERFGHYFVSVALVEGDQAVFYTGSAVGEGTERLLLRDVVVDLRKEQAGLIGEAVRSGRPVLSNDVLNDPRYLPVAGLPDTRAELDVPIRFQERVIGVLDVQSDRLHAFTQEDVALLELLAAQAGVALENARLYAESRRRSEMLSTLFQVGTTLLSTLDPQEVMVAVCREVANLLGATSAYICDWDRERRQVIVIAESYTPEASPAERVSDLGAIYSEKEDVSSWLSREHPHTVHVGDPDLAPEEREHLERYGGKAVLYLPLIARGEISGYIEVWESRYERTFTEEEVLLGQHLAASAAVAIQNARLYAQVQAQLEDLRRAGEVQARLLEQVRLLSTPVIPVHDRILVLPLIGMVDSERAGQFTERLLEAVRRHRARVVLVDVTGVPVVDTAVAQALLQAARATHLLGAEVVLVGIRSEVAQTLVTLGVQLEEIATRANLQAGIEHALGLLGRRIAEAAYLRG